MGNLCVICASRDHAFGVIYCHIRFTRHSLHLKTINDVRSTLSAKPYDSEASMTCEAQTGAAIAK